MQRKRGKRRGEDSIEEEGKKESKRLGAKDPFSLLSNEQFTTLKIYSSEYSGVRVGTKRI